MILQRAVLLSFSLFGILLQKLIIHLQLLPLSPLNPAHVECALYPRLQGLINKALEPQYSLEQQPVTESRLGRWRQQWEQEPSVLSLDICLCVVHHCVTLTFSQHLPSAHSHIHLFWDLGPGVHNYIGPIQKEVFFSSSYSFFFFFFDYFGCKSKLQWTFDFEPSQMVCYFTL